jgi:hypothetical protein
MSVQFCCLAKHPGEVLPVVPTLLHYTPRLPTMAHALARAQVVLGAQSEAAAASLLDGGAHRVFIGEAALSDGGAVERLLKRYGAARIGLHVPVRRQSVSWSFETESNADFRVVTPSLCQPTWEVLLANGESSGVRAAAWMQAMLRLGVQTILMRADICDDTDLNLCAGMVETLGNTLWIAPLNDAAPPIADWIRFGQATQIALPVGLYHQRHALLPRERDADVAAAVA